MTTETATTHVGTVRFYGDKGWGFIAPDDGGKDVFVHVSAVGKAGLRDINQGDRLEFTIETDERSKRPCAANLRLLNW